MDKNILFFSNKIQEKYKFYLNYDICEIILEKINYNMNQINITRDKLKSKIKRINKLLNNKSPKVFDNYLLYNKKKYVKIFRNFDLNHNLKLKILNNIDILN
tara:strand:- start:270 stop:575 length:306 start_codon:yes stop_codon:yes gene_type:complete